MDTIRLEDRRTGRVAVIRRPLAEYLSPAELIALEDTIRCWGNVAAEQQAEETLDRTAAQAPERVLYGLLWLAGLWCSLCAARFGISMDELIGGLDYTGLRRELSGLDEQAWATLTQFTRRGVLAVVTSDADIREYLRIATALAPSLLGIRRHLLTILDGLSQDMQRNDLAPWGAAAHIIGGAGWTA